jgi:putative SOS response-associated peptidase YedK
VVNHAAAYAGGPSWDKLEVMPDRYACYLTEEAIRQAFQVVKPRVGPHLPILPRYRITPTSSAPIIRLDDQLRREIASVFWCFVPPYMGDRQQVLESANVRAELISNHPTYREAMLSRRCLVAATGFFAWRGEGKDVQPYYFGLEGGGAFALGGLWTRWPGIQQPNETFAIVTIQANERVAPICERMPLLLDASRYAMWLGDAGALAGMSSLGRFPIEGMIGYPIGPAIDSNETADDDPGIIEPLPSGALH